LKLDVFELDDIELVQAIPTAGFVENKQFSFVWCKVDDFLIIKELLMNLFDFIVTRIGFNLFDLLALYRSILCLLIFIILVMILENKEVSILFE
jgi:hypothetical protein